MININTSLSYQVLKKDIPSSLVPEEIQWVAEAMSDLPAEHTLTPGVGIFYNIVPGRFSFRGDLFRVHQLQDEVVSGFENQTVLFGGLTYIFKNESRVSLGYKRSFEMEDVTDQSVICDFKINW